MASKGELGFAIMFVLNARKCLILSSCQILIYAVCKVTVPDLISNAIAMLSFYLCVLLVTYTSNSWCCLTKFYQSELDLC